MTTVHLILNAHLDPVWLWPWQAGLDEALATCRSACDRLDAHADIVFTRGEAWVYRQIEQVDSALFERIKAHVAAGQWEIAGGWELQPDCNLPSWRGLQKQIEIGRDYFQSRFGQFPEYAYNVDSFGHAASLPRLLRENGQRFYVMMRPQENEMALPARLFRWRGEDEGAEVTVFRIAGSYLTRGISRGHIEAALSELPEGITHTMCFVGVGDHGGGPTEAQIKWCRENKDAFENVSLEFSSPARFFAAIEGQTRQLPLVTGELQQHAIGCYSVMRDIKIATRRAENLLAQTEAAAPETELDRAWEKVCFAHFHDTLGGTSIPSAMPQIFDGLGYAANIADEALQLNFRRRMNALPPDGKQRIVAFNAASQRYRGWLEHEPWLDWQEWQPGWQLVNEQGETVPCQRIHGEGMAFQLQTPEAEKWGLPRVLFPATLEPGQVSAWRIDRAGGTSLALPALELTPQELPPCVLELIDDPSDTWAHELKQFGESMQTAAWDAAQIGDTGPLMASLFQNGTIGESRLRAEWRRYLGASFLELRLRIHWLEQHKLLKLSLPWQASERRDGIPGGSVARSNDGRELPLRDWTASGATGIVCPGVFALDASEARVRLTLLRSPLLAHHIPHSGQSPRARFSDQGVNEWCFRFYSGAAPEELEASAQMLQQPPLLADLTRGMPLLA